LGIDVPVEGEGKKLYVWFDAPIGYISATKNGRYVKEKNPYWKIKTQAGSFYRQRQYVFTALFSCDVKSRRKLYYQCACK
jgi:hypothetical protein